MTRDDHLKWYHRSLTRDQADDLLKASGIGDGVFLVRDSNTSPGDYVLSVMYNNEVYHYQIRRHGEDAFFSIDDKPPIHGLDALIKHYQDSPDGLVIKLTTNIVNDPPPAEARRHGRTYLLHRATKENNLMIVKEKLNTMVNGDEKYPLDAKDQDGRSVVHLACLLDADNAGPMLEIFLKYNANVNCRDESGNTPLHYAVRDKPVPVIKMLSAAKAHIDARNNGTGRVPLHEAAEYGNLEVVKFLLELGVPHMPRCIHNKTPAELAKEAGHSEIFDYLDTYRPPLPTTHTSHWYHGTLSRSESERALRKHAKTYHENEDASGTFLVRYSIRENTYILGLLNDDQELKNYVIQRVGNHWFIDEGPYMITLDHLVQHYMRFSDGLPTKLRYPVKPIPKPQLPPPLLPSTVAQTLPKSVKLFQKNVSPNVQIPPNDVNKERKMSKDIELSTTQPTSPETKDRNLSSDALMNQVAISSPTISNNNSTSNDTTIFNSFNSLRRAFGGKAKKERRSKSKEVNDTNENPRTPISNDHIANTFTTIEFSSGFNDNSIYKVPKNIPVTSPDVSPNRQTHKQTVQNQTYGANDDLDLFTKSDRNNDIACAEIHDKDNSIEEIYFVDAPTKSAPISSKSIGYVAFNQIPYFPDGSSAIDADTINGNVVNNLTNVPKSTMTRSDKVLSSVSTISNDLAMMLSFQNSSNANASASASANANNIHSSPVTNTKTQPNYYIPDSTIQLSDVLGEGEFGSVFKAHMTIESQNGESKDILVAVKTLRDEHVKKNRIEFLREASVMIKLSHHCIVKMFGISKGVQGLMIVQELVSLGSLLDYLRENAEKINPNSELKIWASQIACGMQYLVTQHFVHRDLAARNILLSSLHQAKISDFGFSRALSAGENYYSTGGGKWPIKWYAPESFNYGTFSHASDVWSFGVTLWEMYSFGMPPYGDMNSMEVTAMIGRGERLPQPFGCPNNVFEIMSSCWNFHPRDRPTFRYLTEYFSNDPGYQNIVELIRTENIY